MKKILCFIITISMLLSSISVAYARNGVPGSTNGRQSGSNTTNTGQNVMAEPERDSKPMEEIQTFLVSKLTILKYGKYKIPLEVIEDGMNAEVDLDRVDGILTIVGEDDTEIEIDFEEEIISVDGDEDNDTSIFKAKNSKKMRALLYYLADQLGYDIEYSTKKITVIDLNNTEAVQPDNNTAKSKNDKSKNVNTTTTTTTDTSIVITPVGTSVVENTLNTTTLYITATANITADDATGGYAQLYVGANLVATDSEIESTDTTVDFTTSDGTPTNEELQELIPQGGKVKVMLYDSSNNLVATTTSKKQLVVDYKAPTITSVVSAVCSVTGGSITITVTGAGALNDLVDVSKISLYDSTLNTSYQLTTTTQKGITSIVKSSTKLTIKLNSVDKSALASYGTSSVYMNIAAGSLIYDVAGNTSTAFTSVMTIPVTITK